MKAISPYRLIYPLRHHISATTRIFPDFLAEHFADDRGTSEGNPVVR